MPGSGAQYNSQTVSGQLFEQDQKYYGEFRGLVPGLFGFHPPPPPPPSSRPMGRSAEKRAADRLLTQAKLDQSDATTYAKYVEACINVMFHNQKGLSLAKLNEMKKAVSPGMRLWPALATFTRVSAEKFIQLYRCLCRREGKHSHTATRTRRRRGRCGQDHAGPPVRRTSR